MKSVKTGKDSDIDANVLIGYKTARKIKNRELLIGARAKIRSGSVIYEGSTIGDGLETGHNVVIREENKIGSNFRIWNNSVVDYGCKIGNNVKVHSNCYIAQFTEIEDSVFIAPGTITANDLYPGIEESRKAMKGPKIRAGAQIGVNCTILPFVVIGKNAIVGAGSVVTGDVPDDAVVAGNPARVIKHRNDLDIEKLRRRK